MRRTGGKTLLVSLNISYMRIQCNQDLDEYLLDAAALEDIGQDRDDNYDGHRHSLRMKEATAGNHLTNNYI